jgi:hypothetical protein
MYEIEIFLNSKICIAPPPLDAHELFRKRED